MTGYLQLTEKHRMAIEALVRKHLPGVEAWVYGSRVAGRSHDGSDLDLVLRGPGLERISINCLSVFSEAVRESRIPILVDAKDWARLPDYVRRDSRRIHVALVE